MRDLRAIGNGIERIGHAELGEDRHRVAARRAHGDFDALLSERGQRLAHARQRVLRLQIFQAFPIICILLRGQRFLFLLRVRAPCFLQDNLETGHA